MKIGVLTSSRADYSIYYPLLDSLRSDDFFDLSLLAFGTHLSTLHGHTVNRILADGFNVTHALHTYPESDSPESVSLSMGRTIEFFSDVWKKSNFDLVFCLGDRYEMFAACASAMPFNITLAHLHGGEQTLGAIDDAFRHSITHMARYHFTAAEEYQKRVVMLKGSSQHVHNVGSLSIDNLKNLRMLSIPEFSDRFGIDLSTPSILITFHPETISFERNEQYVNELVSALNTIKGYQFIITMPNADTMGNLIRARLSSFIERTPHALGVESFGTLGYLSCMKHCSFMLGNTSSGYIEASYFPKYVIDLGDRQKGRIITSNIRKCEIEKNAIIEAVRSFTEITLPAKIDIYGTGDASNKIVNILKSIQ